jgi:hypothetical protein
LDNAGRKSSRPPAAAQSFPGIDQTQSPTVALVTDPRLLSLESFPIPIVPPSSVWFQATE